MKKLILISVQLIICIVSFGQISIEPRGLWNSEPFGVRDQSKELVEKRDAFSKHFLNEDGTITAHIAAGYINYFEDNQWKTIFHTIVPTQNGFENTTNSHKTYFPLTSSGEITTVLKDGSKLKDMRNMRMYYQVNNQETLTRTIQDKQGNSVFNELTYKGVYGNGIDLRLTQQTTKRKMDYIINSKEALGTIPAGADFLIFEEMVELPVGWIATLKENTILLSNTVGELKATYEKPEFYDEVSNKSETENYSPFMTGEYEIEQSGRLVVIKTKVPLSWLLDTNRSFPVVIDPTIGTYYPSIPNTNAANTDHSNWTGTLGTVQSGTNAAAKDAAMNTSTTLTTAHAMFHSDDFIRVGAYVQGSHSNPALPPQNHSYAMHGWAKFNTSSIAVGSLVSSVTLYTFIYERESSGTTVINNRLRQLSTDPETASSADRLSDIRDGSEYRNLTTAYPVGWRGGTVAPGGTPTVAQQGVVLANTWRHFPLFGTPTASSILQANLSNGWFGVGFNPYSTDGSASHLALRGYSNSNKPYIVLDYSPLPIVLSSFSASCDENNTHVTWTTASEQNSDYFTLERSRDGYQWEVIATIEGAGTTQQTNNYSVEENTYSGNSYYRLKQTDYDGQTKSYGPIYANCNSKTNELIVYPNPNNGSFTVSVNSAETMGEATVFVQDMSGKVIFSRYVNVLSGTNTVHFENTNLSQGAYLVSVQGKDKKAFVPVKLVIQ